MNKLFALIVNFIVITTAVLTTSVLLASCSAHHSTEFSGFNGPASPGIYIFNSATEVDASWLKRALHASEYQSLMLKVDFGRQQPVALAAGERLAVTGDLELTQIRASHSSLNMTALVRVAAKECSALKKKSYPFVVVLLQKNDGMTKEQGFDIANAPGFCGGEKSAESSEN